MTKSLFQGMRRLVLALGAMGLLLTASQPTYAATAAEVEAAARKLVDLYIANDVEAYFGMMSDNSTMWAGSNSNPARTTKQGYYTSWKALIGRGGGISKGSLTDVKVQMTPANDAAIVTGILSVTQRVPTGDTNPPRDIVYKITQVWFQEAGGLKLHHYFWSSVLPPAPGAAAPAAAPAAPAAR